MLAQSSSHAYDLTSRRKGIGRRSSSLGAAAQSSRFNLELEYKTNSQYESGFARRASQQAITTEPKLVYGKEIDDMIKEMRGMGLAELLTRMRECVGINHKVNEMVALVNDQYREIKELKAALRDRVETRAMDNHIRLMRAQFEGQIQNARGRIQKELEDEINTKITMADVDERFKNKANMADFDLLTHKIQQLQSVQLNQVEHLIGGQWAELDRRIGQLVLRDEYQQEIKKKATILEVEQVRRRVDASEEVLNWVGAFFKDEPSFDEKEEGLDSKVIDDILLGKRILDEKMRHKSPIMRNTSIPEKAIDTSHSTSKDYIKIMEGVEAASKMQQNEPKLENKNSVISGTNVRDTQSSRESSPARQRGASVASREKERGSKRQYKQTILEQHEQRVKKQREEEEKLATKIQVDIPTNIPLDSDPYSPLSETLAPTSEGQPLLYNPVSSHTSKLRSDVLPTIKKATGSIRRTIARNPLRWLKHLRSLILDNAKELDRHQDVQTNLTEEVVLLRNIVESLSDTLRSEVERLSTPTQEQIEREQLINEFMKSARRDIDTLQMRMRRAEEFGNLTNNELKQFIQETLKDQDQKLKRLVGIEREQKKLHTELMETKAERKSRQKEMADEMHKLNSAKIASEMAMKRLAQTLNQLAQKQSNDFANLLDQFQSVKEPFLAELNNMRAENSSLARQIQRFEDLYRNLVIEFVKILESKDLGSNKGIQELVNLTKDNLLRKRIKDDPGNSSPVSKFFITNNTPDLEDIPGNTFKQKMQAIQQFGHKLQKSGKQANEEAEKANEEKEKIITSLGSGFHLSARTQSQTSKAFNPRIAQLRRQMHSVGLNKNLSSTSTGLPQQEDERNLRTAISAVRRGLDYKKKEIQMQSFGVHQDDQEVQFPLTSDLSETPSAASFQKGVQSANRLRSIVRLQSRGHLQHNHPSMRSFSSGKPEVLRSFDNTETGLQHDLARPGSSNISQRPVSRGQNRHVVQIPGLRTFSQGPQPLNLNNSNFFSRSDLDSTKDLQPQQPNPVTISPKMRQPSKFSGASSKKGSNGFEELDSQDSQPHQGLTLHRFQHLVPSLDSNSRGNYMRQYKSALSGSRPHKFSR